MKICPVTVPVVTLAAAAAVASAPSFRESSESVLGHEGPFPRSRCVALKLPDKLAAGLRQRWCQESR